MKKNKLQTHSAAANEQHENSVEYVNVCMCLNASLWQ